MLSPVLSILEPKKKTFLKNNWSEEGMGQILMQPVDDK